WRYAFMGLVRKHPDFTDAAAIAASCGNWNRHMGLLNAQLMKTGAYVTGKVFTVADIVLGLATHRWLLSPIVRPDFPALAAYYERLSNRPAFQCQTWLLEP
ncbi:MAG: glutathione S-transferase C-terminal domain-containing protein, partial [Betaproteobacteria bacterium]